MSPKRDDVLLLAVVIGVACPAANLPLAGNPTNLAALLVFAEVLRSGPARARAHCFHLLALVLGLAMLSTAAGLLAVLGPYTISPQPFGSFLRIGVCLYAFCEAADRAAMQRKLLWVGCGASLFGVLQFFSPAVGDFTLAHYLAAERSTVLFQDFSGRIIRVIGLYENPSSVALMALVQLLVSVHAFAAGRLRPATLALFVLVNFTAGILCLSKIFVFCLPILLLQLVVLRFRTAAFASAAALAALAAAFLDSDLPVVGHLRYTIESAMNADRALRGRYLLEQQDVVLRSWLFGYGGVRVQDVIINDSAYLVVGAVFGLFGALALALFLGRSLWRDGWRMSFTAGLVTLGALIAGVGANSVIGFRVDILFTALFATLLVGPGIRRIGAT